MAEVIEFPEQTQVGECTNCGCQVFYIHTYLAEVIKGGVKHFECVECGMVINPKIVELVKVKDA